MKSLFSGLSQVTTTQALTTLTATTLTATSVFMIWYGVIKKTFDDVSEIAANTDFAITVVEPKKDVYALGYKEKSEEETEEGSTENIIDDTTENTIEKPTQDGQSENETTYTTRDEVVDAIAKKLKEDGIETKNVYLDEKSGYIQKFIEAEITTNYPNLSHKYGNVKKDIGDKVEDVVDTIIPGANKEEKAVKYLQGIINVIRRDAQAEEDDLGQYLEYIPNGDTDKKGTFQYMANQNDPETLKYFSINESDWSILVATYKKVSGDEENSYTISTQSIPYKNVVAKYSVPFEFLVALADVSDNPEWADKVADMVLRNSKIDLVFQDCLTITKKEVTYSYDEVTEGYVGGTQISRNVVPHSSTSVTTTEQNTITSYVREVDTWIVNVKQNYEKKEEGPTVGEPSVENLENSDYHSAEIPNPLNEGTLMKVQGQKENRKNTTVITTTTIKYDKSTTVNNENQDLANTSMNKYLMLGDSDMVKLKEEGQILEATYCAEANATPQYWLDHFDSLPDAKDVNGVCVLLGKYSISEDDQGVKSMKALIDQLEQKYEGKRIYIQRVFPLSETIWDENLPGIDGEDQVAAKRNELIKSYNGKIQSYCNKKTVEYIDTTTGMVDNNGHLTKMDYAKWATNIKKAIIGQEDNQLGTSSSVTTSTDNENTKKYKIGIMAGHSSVETGASSPAGDNNLPVVHEEKMTVEVADYVEKYLSKYDNIEVVQVGSTVANTAVRDSGRLQKAIDANVDVLVSIHFNAGATSAWQDTESGVSICYNKAGTAGDGSSSEADSSSGSHTLGEKIKQAIAKKTGLSTCKDTEKPLFTIGNSKNTSFPSVITECGYLDNKSDYAIITTEQGKQNYAKGIVDGILEYLQIENKGYGDGNSDSSGGSGAIITSNEKKFLGLWKNKKGKYIEYYNSDGTYNKDALFAPNGKLVKYKEKKTSFFATKAPGPRMESNAKVLFELLASSERTQQEEQLMRYLMYIYTGNDYGVTDFDFRVFDLEEFSKAGVKGGNAFLLFMKAWEGATMDSEGNYIVEDDGVGIPTVGFGIALKYNVERFASRGVYGVDTWQIGDHCLKDHGVPNDIIDSVMMEEFDTYREKIKQQTSSCSPALTTQQIDALVAISYQYGGIGNFVEAYNTHGNTDALKDAAHQTGKWAYYFKQNPSVGRAEANWKLFHEGIYIDKEGNEIVSSGGTFLENAELVHAYMEENKYGYCLFGEENDSSHGGIGGSHGLDATFEESKTGHPLTCCATYVSWVLYESGYTEFTNVNGCSMLDPMLRSMGAQEISDYSQLQAGDICFRGTDHVQIYAGNGTWYNAGSNDSIRRDSPYSGSMSGFTHALRLAQ